MRSAEVNVLVFYSGGVDARSSVIPSIEGEIRAVAAWLANATIALRLEQKGNSNKTVVV